MGCRVSSSLLVDSVTTYGDGKISRGRIREHDSERRLWPHVTVLLSSCCHVFAADEVAAVLVVPKYVQGK